MRVDRVRHEQIKCALRIAGTNFSNVAAELGIKPSSVSEVSLGTSRSRRVEHALATALSTPVETLFADRYGDQNDLET
ncbi:transcriptional regulator, Nlp family [Celeribacter baekdonensis]|uniref:Transcriptional regulator, Nlp family n=1 Tax=Celeribacter baekdonensis TaxID=875171 RepID=A0A1G7UCZ2_9RHOB|nr:transcriptional regulator, Nlp family [Celeribacter baekdonensis]